MWGFIRKRNIPLEEQLEALVVCGIRLRPGISINHLLQSFDRETYERDPYLLLATVMGGEAEEDGFVWISDNLWHFDTECIEDTGAYVRIAERMRALAGAALPLESIQDHVDVEQGKAWLEFTLDGQRLHWPATVRDDWVDPAILSRFAELLATRKSAKSFTYLDLGGQDCLIGCCSQSELTALNDLGLKFTPLK